MALCTTKKITLAEDTKDSGESNVDGAPLKECIGDKSMEQETVSFRFIYLLSNEQMGCPNEYFVRAKDLKYLVDLLQLRDLTLFIRTPKITFIF